jgi:hypothetical protein
MADSDDSTDGGKIGMPGPFDEWRKVQKITDERVDECYNKFIQLWMQLLNDDTITTDEFFVSLKEILPSDDDSVGEIEHVKKYKIADAYLKKVDPFLKQVMNDEEEGSDFWILEKAVEIIEVQKNQTQKKIIDAMMEHQFQLETLHVESWNLSDKEKKKWWKEWQHDLGHKRLSKETLKKVMTYLLDFRDWDDNLFKKSHKFGGLKIEEEETQKEIFKRIENNLMNVPQTYQHGPSRYDLVKKANKRKEKGDPDKILIILLLTISELDEGRLRISKLLINFSKLTLHDTKRKSQVELFYEKYNKKKDHGHSFLLQACLQYLTRPMSSKQKTMLKERRGISSNWASKFTWDYFEAYKKMQGDMKYYRGLDGNWDQLDTQYYEKKTDEVSVTINKLLKEEIDNCISELVKCIKKEYIIFDFFHFTCLEDNMQKLLIRRLKEEYNKEKSKTQTKEEFDNQNLAVGSFLQKFQEKHTKFSIEFLKNWADHGDKNEIRASIDPGSSNSFNEIQYMFEWKKKEWYISEEESETFEFKSNFYKPPPSIFAQYKKEKKEWGERGKKEPFPKERDFTKTEEKKYEIELMKEVCAFLNHKGGKLFFGIDDSTGLVFGIDRDKESKYKGLTDKKFRDDHERKIKQVIKHHFPDENIKVNFVGPFLNNNKFVILIDVPQSDYKNIELAKHWSPAGGFSKTKCFVYRDGTSSVWECRHAKYVERLGKIKKRSDD